MLQTGDTWMIHGSFLISVPSCQLCRRESTVRSKIDLSFPGSLGEPSNPRYLMLCLAADTCHHLSLPNQKMAHLGAQASAFQKDPIETKLNHLVIRWETQECFPMFPSISSALMTISKWVCSLVHFPKTWNTSLDIFGVFWTECVSRVSRSVSRSVCSACIGLASGCPGWLRQCDSDALPRFLWWQIHHKKESQTAELPDPKVSRNANIDAYSL